MNNVENEKLLRPLQAATLQQSVEEAYLDSLLSPLPDNGEQGICVHQASVKEEPVNTPESVEYPEQQSTEINAVSNDTNTDSPQLDEKSVKADSVDDNINESWPQLPFVCQLINLAGLKLALPLSGFTQVLPWPGEVISAGNGQESLVGHMKSGACVFDIVDLAGLIMNKALAQTDSNGKYPYSHVLLLQDGSTCLPCDDMLETVTVDPDKVCWRNPDSQRIWLAGTVKEDGFALLDAEKIMQLNGNQ